MSERNRSNRPAAAGVILGVALCLGCSGPGPEDRAPQPPLAPVDALTPAPSDDPCETAAAFVAGVRASLQAALDALPDTVRVDALNAGRFAVGVAPSPVTGDGPAGRVTVKLSSSSASAPFFSVDIVLPVEEPPSLATVELGARNALLVSFLYGASGRFSCHYFVFPSGSGIDSLKLPGFISVSDLDGDGTDEIVSSQDLYEAYEKCDPPMALIPAWPEIYRFDLERRELVRVSERHPDFYAARLKEYKEQLEAFWSKTECREEFLGLIRKAESLAKRPNPSSRR